MIERSRIRLHEYLGEEAWGEAAGRGVYLRLVDAVASEGEATVFELSLAGVRRFDTAFAREAIVELARRYRGSKGFYLSGVSTRSRELAENIGAAADERSQPLVDWTSGAPILLGPLPTPGNEEALRLALRSSPVTARTLIAELGLKSSNASNKLITLYKEGFLVREMVVRETDFGRRGTEFEYSAVGPARVGLRASA